MHVDFNGIGYRLTNNVAEHEAAANSYGEIEEPCSEFFNFELLPGFAFADYYASGVFGDHPGWFIGEPGWDEVAVNFEVIYAQILS